MKKARILLGNVLLAYSLLSGCSSAPNEADVAASVEAQLAVALAQTAVAVSEDSAVPTPPNTTVSADAPAPAETPIPTNTPDWEATRLARAPTRTPEPTSTPRPTSTPTPVPEPVILSGSGDSVVDLEGWPGGEPAILHITGPNTNANFAVWNYDARGNRIDLLVNTIGAYEGFLPMDFFEDQKTSRFEITAAGAWTIEVLPIVPEHMHTNAVPGSYEGNGDDVVFLTGESPDIGDFATSSDGNFAVWSLGDRGRDLLINEIAPYEGRVIVPRDTLLLIVTSAGPWSMKISGS